MRIILASASPRRKELMSMLGFNELIVVPAKGEERVPEGLTPGEIAGRLAAQKALEVSERAEDEDVIVAADTIVVLDGKIFGKPGDAREAHDMLCSLSGRSHEVYTGVSVIRGKKHLSGYERTLVRFRELSEDEIYAYISTGEPMDKAGAYGAQGVGALIVEGIEGDFFNVMGLPLCRLGAMLKQQGVTVL